MASGKQYEVLSVQDQIKRISQWTVEILLLMFLALSLTHLFGTRVRMEGNSMTPTLAGEDRMLLNRLKGKVISIQRYDIIVYQLPGQEGVFLKRVLGLPGETLQISGGEILINGRIIPESEYTRFLSYAGVAAEPVELGEGEYFVVGENPDASLDSRFTDVGNISIQDILGTVWLRFSPFKDIRFFN